MDEDSQGYNPHTPLEPYPYGTQLNITTRSTTQNIPLIDTQVFSPWESQEVEGVDKSEVELLDDGNKVEKIRLTQSQPMDLTIQHEPEFDEDDANSTSVPYGSQKLAFEPSLPLDLRLPSRKGITAASAGEMEDVNSQFTSPMTQGFVQRLAALEEAANTQKQIPSTTPQPTTSVAAPKPGTSSQKEFKNKLDALVDRESEDFVAQVTTEIDDFLNRVKGTKRQPEEEEENDDDCFLPSTPGIKLSKFYTPGKRVLGQENPGTGPEQSPVPSTSTEAMEPTGNVEEKWIQELVASSLTPPSPIRKFVFCTTRLNWDQLKKVERLCTLSGGEISKELSPQVTHLILKMENNRIQYTLKYLMGIALKKWILTFDWVEECLKESRIVPEDPYETSNFPGSDPGVQISRKSTTQLFHDFNFYVPYNLSTSSISASACKVLLSTLGGVVLQNLPLCKKRLLIIGELKNSTVINYRKWYETHGCLTVAWDWILNCVLFYKLTPILPQWILTPGVDGIEQGQASLPRPLASL